MKFTFMSSHLRLGFSSGIFPSGFPTKILYTLLLSTVRATSPSHIILLYFITQNTLVEEYRSLSSSLFRFLHYLLTSSLLDPNILNSLVSNILSLRSSLNMSDQVSQLAKL
jgi:hypothetical protein